MFKVKSFFSFILILAILVCLLSGCSIMTGRYVNKLHKAYMSPDHFDSSSLKPIGLDYISDRLKTPLKIDEVFIEKYIEKYSLYELIDCLSDLEIGMNWDTIERYRIEYYDRLSTVNSMLKNNPELMKCRTLIFDGATLEAQHGAAGFYENQIDSKDIRYKSGDFNVGPDNHIERRSAENIVEIRYYGDWKIYHEWGSQYSSGEYGWKNGTFKDVPAHWIPYDRYHVYYCDKKLFISEESPYSINRIFYIVEKDGAQLATSFFERDYDVGGTIHAWIIIDKCNLSSGYPSTTSTLYSEVEKSISPEQLTSELTAENMQVPQIIIEFREQIQDDLLEVLDNPSKVSISNSGNIVINESVLFDVGASGVKPESIPIMTKLMDDFEKLLIDPDNIQCVDKIMIEGHTDSTGNAEDNLELSINRATRVLECLLANREELQPFSSVFYAVGYGDTRPIASNDTEEGRALNRRIEISIVPSNDSSNYSLSSEAEELNNILTVRGDSLIDAASKSSTSSSTSHTTFSSSSSSNSLQKTAKCNNCSGTGKVDGGTCPWCNGSGKTYDNMFNGLLG